jgi:N-terminal domain of anti-restriction factor ArdC/IrrE N-terminal-like domain
MQNDKVASLFTRLEEGLSETLESGNWRDILLTQSRFRHYSFSNTVLILLQRPDATRVAGYKTWQSLGRQVRKGEKAIEILAPIRKTREIEGGDGEKETVYALAGFRHASVFDVSQTIGDELPPIDSPLKGGDAGLISRLVEFSRENGVPVRFEGALGANGYCRYRNGKPFEIVVDPLLPELHRAKTLAHEVAHSLMHGGDDYRVHTKKSLLELEAESVAYLVAIAFGLDTSGYSFPYIACWQETEDALANLKASGERIRKTAALVLDRLEERAVETGEIAVSA